MQRYFAEIKIKIQDKKFNTEISVYPKTALVSFIDKNNKIISEKEYGYADQAYISDYIHANNELQLDECLIDNFNLDFLKKSISSEKLILSNFSAKGSIFFSENNNLDFSELIFESHTVNFQESFFICEELSFSASNFYAEFINFSSTVFKCSAINFSKCKFAEAELSFKNALFSESSKDFQGIETFGGKVNFVNTDFRKGDVFFTDAKFINTPVSFKVSEFDEGRIDFSRVVFGGNETSFEKAIFGNGDISFRSADFQDGKVVFTSSLFGSGKKSFVNTNFGDGNIYFKNVNFGNGNAVFRLSTFGKGLVDFHYCEFGKGNVQFDRARLLSGGLDMKAVNFGEGKVSFNKTYFGEGDLDFEGTTLKGHFYMKDSVFGNGEFNFKESNFSEADVEIVNVDFGIGKISFNMSNFRTLSLKGSQLDNYFDLRISSCEMLDLSNTVVKDILDLNPPDFTPDIKAIDFSGMRLLGRIYIDWRRADLKHLIYNQNTTYKSKEEQFRILKENFNLTGQYSYEDEAYVEFKRTEAVAYLRDEIKNNPKLKIWSYIKYAFKWLIFDKMGKFATDPLRVLFTMLITYLFFTSIYIVLGEFSDIHIISSLFEPDDPKVLGSIGKAFYHSAITFLTIGYGDYYPDGISRWISSIEGFVGLFLMSYFTVAFVRKILR
jgi:hypothetical protein